MQQETFKSSDPILFNPPRMFMCWKDDDRESQVVPWLVHAYIPSLSYPFVTNQGLFKYGYPMGQGEWTVMKLFNRLVELFGTKFVTDSDSMISCKGGYDVVKDGELIVRYEDAPSKYIPISKASDFEIGHVCNMIEMDLNAIEEMDPNAIKADKKKKEGEKKSTVPYSDIFPTTGRWNSSSLYQYLNKVMGSCFDYIGESYPNSILGGEKIYYRLYPEAADPECEPVLIAWSTGFYTKVHTTIQDDQVNLECSDPVKYSDASLEDIKRLVSCLKVPNAIHPEEE